MPLPNLPFNPAFCFIDGQWQPSSTASPKGGEGAHGCLYVRDRVIAVKSSQVKSSQVTAACTCAIG